MASTQYAETVSPAGLHSEKAAKVKPEDSPLTSFNIGIPPWVITHGVFALYWYPPFDQGLENLKMFTNYETNLSVSAYPFENA